MKLPSLLAGAGLLWAMGVDAFLLLADTYSGLECGPGAGGEVECKHMSRSFLAENGNGALIWLVLPTTLALAVFVLTLRGLNLSRFFSWFLAVTLFGLCLLTGFSTGLLYLPAALACVLAVILQGPRERQSAAAPGH